MYQTLYRKYRPTNFDEVIGQKVIVKTLENAIMNNKLSHAYIFTGPRGTGKTSIAKILAHTINCENINKYIPCNKCVNCTQNDNHIDILEIDAASNNGVDEIRELKNKVNLVPALGKYKVYIIDEVHMLSTGAFNALLKTLEEPPKHAIFILATTDPHKVPATILSRCQRFDFKKLNNNEMIERMNYICKKEQIMVEAESLKEIAILSDGGMRDALSLLDQAIAYSNDKISLENIHEINGTITRQELTNFINLIIDNDLAELFKKIDKYDMDGKDFVKLTEEIIEFLRDIIIKMNVPQLYNQQMKYEIEEETINKMNNNLIMNYIKDFNNEIINMKNSNNPRIIFELAIIKMININNNEKEQYKEPKLCKNIEKIRINNTLCSFNKKELVEFNKELEKLNKLILNTEYAEYISLIKDGILKAKGNNNLLFIFENSNYVKMFNSNLDKIDAIFMETYNVPYKAISVDFKKWEQIKKEFNNKEKEYKYINE